MKLLFVQNLSPKLVNRLADLLPDSSHVQTVGLDCASDDQVWEHAGVNGSAIVTKDEDYMGVKRGRGSLRGGWLVLARTAAGTETVTQARSLGHFPHPGLIIKRAAALDKRPDGCEFSLAVRLMEPLDPVGCPRNRPR